MSADPSPSRVRRPARRHPSSSFARYIRAVQFSSIFVYTLVQKTEQCRATASQNGARALQVSVATCFRCGGILSGDFWATVCKTVRRMLSHRCLYCLSCPICLSVTLVYCGKNGWMDQDATWYGDRPRPRPHCVRWGPSSPHGNGQSSPLFLVHFALTRSPISATAERLLQRTYS